MISNISELKEFIVWAKSQKLKSISVSGVSFEFSDLALVEGLTDLGTPDESKPKDLSVPASSPRLPDGNAQANEDESLLFWSTR